jgi:large subunit ribosomal protein L32e
MEEVTVWNAADLENVNPQEQVARIGGTVGAKKRATIKAKAAELNIRILNPGIAEKKDEFEELKDEEPEEQAEDKEAEEEPAEDKGDSDEEEDEK